MKITASELRNVKEAIANYDGPEKPRKNHIMVYQIFFEDGTNYVGITQRDIKTRILSHAKGRKPGDSNISAVYRKIYTGMRFGFTVCARQHKTPYLARKAESKLCQELQKYGQKVLNTKNTTTVLKHPQWPHFPPREQRQYHCYICQRYLDSKYFVPDHHRSCGYSSKCKSCRYTILAMMRHFNLTWKDGQTAMLQMMEDNKNFQYDWIKSIQGRKKWKGKKCHQWLVKV